jgi:hypothetical protein
MKPRITKDFSKFFTVEVWFHGSWEVVFSGSSEEEANERWLEILKDGEYVRMTSPKTYVEGWEK